MAKQPLFQKFFNGGISQAEKEGLKGAFLFGRGLDIYQDPNKVTILPAAVKVSGANVTGLVKWITQGTPHDTNNYFYDDGGKIYQENSGGTWSLARTVSSSVGQGLEVHNDYLIYAQNTQLGLYGPLSSGPAFTDNWQTGLTDTSSIGYAPIKAFQAGFAVGHGNKLGWWDGSTWTAAQLTLPTGLYIRSLEVVDEFLFIGAWSGTTITQSERGYVFVWDGVSSNPNFFFANPEGGCNAMLNSRNRLISVWGSSGYIYQGYNPFEKIHQLPKLTLGTYAEVLPGAVTNWKGIAMIGFAGNTDSTTIQQGVYGWGSKSSQYPEVLNYMFPISTGTLSGTTLKIGALRGIGNNLYIGWRDGSTYGVDKVTNSGAPQSSAVLEALIFDDDNAESKALDVLKTSHLALASGESVQLGYKLDRVANYTTGTANSTVSTTETRLPLLSATRFIEMQMEIVLGAGSTAPTITSYGMQYDDMKEEKDY